jgi:hypothetical protein
MSVQLKLSIRAVIIGQLLSNFACLLSRIIVTYWLYLRNLGHRLAQHGVSFFVATYFMYYNYIEKDQQALKATICVEVIS